MRVQLRMIRLLSLARFRAAGWAPWLLFAGWIAAAAFQEPRLLRRYGIHLLDDAAWTGGLVLLIVFLFAEKRLPRRGAAAANLTVLGLVAVLQAVVAYLADQGAWTATPLDRAQDVGMFFLAWAPLTLVLSRQTSFEGVNRWLVAIVVLTAFVMGSMLAVALRSDSDTFAFLGAGLAMAASLCWLRDRSGSEATI